VAVAVDQEPLPALVDLESVVLVAQVPEMLQLQIQVVVVAVQEAHCFHQLVVLVDQESFM
jgi:hypothetical protein